jgi:hypothetical protein
VLLPRRQSTITPGKKDSIVGEELKRARKALFLSGGHSFFPRALLTDNRDQIRTSLLLSHTGEERRGNLRNSTELPSNFHDFRRKFRKSFRSNIRRHFRESEIGPNWTKLFQFHFQDSEHWYGGGPRRINLQGEPSQWSQQRAHPAMGLTLCCSESEGTSLT